MEKLQMNVTMSHQTNIGDELRYQQNNFLHPHGCGVKGCPICWLKVDFELVNPHCEVCHGAGWIHQVDQATGHIFWDKHVVPCPAPGCYKENWINQGIVTLTRVQTFETFKAGNTTLRKAEHAAKNFCNETGQCLFLHFGGHGCGKTHLLHAIWNQRRAQSKPVVKYAMMELFNKLQDAIGNHTIEQKFAEAAAVEMLLLDDLDMRFLTEWKLERFKELLDYRIQNCLWTHITTHNTLEEIKAKESSLDDRFADITKCVCIFNDTPSQRKERR